MNETVRCFSTKNKLDMKEVRTYKVVGGICPGAYRSTSLSVECENIQDGYEKVTYWARKNFSDFNRIGTFDGKSLLGLVTVRMPTSIYCNGKSKSKRKL